MPVAFDPYHKWLGIPPQEQPPNHYRLLGISLFESDPDVIDAAASKQVAYLQSCATGPHVALSQKILNEIAAARLCLLNAEKKAAYDAGVKGESGSAGVLSSAEQPSDVWPASPVQQAGQVDEPPIFSGCPMPSQPLGFRLKRQRTWQSRQILAVTAIAIVLSGTVATFLLTHGANEDPIQRESEEGGKVSLAPPHSTLVPAEIDAKDLDRSVAQWVLSKGGTVDIEEGGRTTRLTPNDPLPKQSFVICVIKLTGANDITDDELKPFGKLCSLQRLQIGATPITDLGLEYLANLTSLRNLHIQNTKITGDGLRHLAALPQLESLDIGRITLGQAGRQNLSRMQTLRRLHLNFTDTSDDNVLFLADIKGIKTVSLHGTKVTQAGIARLKAAIPGIAVRW
jgi:hypothetical protein